jgi:TRAP-type C4-dicarboxylate transport system permease small subunit
MLNRLYRTARYASRLLAIAGAGLMIGGMLVTVADVVLRSVTDSAIEGTIDITQLFVVIIVFLSIPYAFLTDAHVAVAVLTDRLPERLDALLRGFAALLGLVTMGLLTRYGLDQALLQYDYGDVSQTIAIPILWYWVPLMAGVGVSVLATALLCAGHFAHAVTGQPFMPAADASEADAT